MTYAIDAVTAGRAIEESAGWPSRDDEEKGPSFGGYIDGVRDALRWVTTGETTEEFLYVINPVGQPDLPARG